MIPEDVIEQVRESADVLGIIGESVQLKRTGADWRGPCPFHGGKNRNFAVIPKKGLFYCYVCHEAGDVFSYLMKRFGMDYPTAVRDVARRSGIVIPERTEQAGPDPNASLHTAVSSAHEWFAEQLESLPEAETARAYLAGREIDPATAKRLGVGYAPRGRALLDELQRRGIGEATLLEAGLAVRRDDGTVAARFRGRLIFPIHDQRGRVVAFGGRILGEGEPKYLNSPESPIFSKGKTLYNLHAARNAIRREETAILVEGYFDVIRLVLAGIEHVVAPLGTALTPDQAALIRKFAPAVTLLYDSDQAGLRATFRAGDELLRQGVRVRVATMPAGEDPDTIVRGGGAAALQPILDDAVDLLERKIQLLAARGWFEDTEHRRNALDRLLPTIRAAADPITRELYLTRVAERSGVSKVVLEQELRLQPRRYAGPAAERAVVHHAPEAPPAEGDGIRAEEELLRVIVRSPEWRERARELMRPEHFDHPAHRELFEALMALPPNEAATQLPPSLGHAAQLKWISVREAAERLTGADADATFTATSAVLLSRPERREIDRIVDPIERRKRLDDLLRRYGKAEQARWLQRAVRKRK
ncbi:MAG TPA: DNA primase [Gemmatimonadales bacterium]|nr:DNA primase [Gemmatimonadales bacterium]